MFPYNQWFYCNMDELIETNGNKIKCWIYGHTHTPSNVIINGIPFLSNPIGYPNENVNLNFLSTIRIGVKIIKKCKINRRAYNILYFTPNTIMTDCV